MAAYRLMCLDIKKMMKSGDVVFMEDSGSMTNNLEMCRSGRNEGRTVVVVGEFSKPPLLDGGGQYMEGNKRVGVNEVAIEGPRERVANIDIIVESLDEEQIVDVRNGGHHTGLCICGKRGKPIYVKTGSNILDGR